MIKENQSKNEVINTLAGNFSCQNIGKQSLEHPGIFYNQSAGFERIFTFNKEQSLDEPIEIVKDWLNH